MTALKYFVESGLGLALIPDIVLNPVPAGTVIREMEGVVIDMTCGILCKLSNYPLKLTSSRLYGFLKQELTV